MDSVSLYEGIYMDKRGIKWTTAIQISKYTKRASLNPLQSDLWKLLDSSVDSDVDD